MMTPELKRVKNLQVEERQYQLSPGLKLLNGNPITPGSSLKGTKELKRTPPRNMCTPSPNHIRRDQYQQDENFDPDEELTGELWYVNLKTPMEEPQQKLSFEPVDFGKVVDGNIPSGNSLARSPVRMSQEEFCPLTPGNTDFEVREVVIEPGSRIPRTPLHYTGRPSAACDLVIHYSKNKARDITNNRNQKEDSKSQKIRKPRKRSISSNSIPVGEDDHVTVTGEFKTKPKLSRTPLKRLSMQPNEKPNQELQIIDENEPPHTNNCNSSSPNTQVINNNVLESHDIFKPSKKLARSPNPPSKTQNHSNSNSCVSPDMMDTVPECANQTEELICESYQVSVSSESQSVPLSINATPEAKKCSKTAKVCQVNSSSKIPRLSPKGDIQCEPDLNTNTHHIVVQTASHDQTNGEHCDHSTQNQSFKQLNEKSKDTELNSKSSESTSLSVNISNDEPMRPLLSPAIKVRKPVKNMIPKGKSLMRTPPSGKYPKDEDHGMSMAPSFSPVEEDVEALEDPDAIFLAQLRNNDPLPNKKKKPFLKSNKSRLVNNKLKKPAVVKTNTIESKSSAEIKPSNKIETELRKKDRKLTYVVSKPVRTDNVENVNKASMSIKNCQKNEPSSVSCVTLSKPVANNSKKLKYVVPPNPTLKECEDSFQESDTSLLCLDELCDKSLNLCDSLFNEAFERKTSTSNNTRSTAVSSFDSIICSSSPQNDVFPMENISLGDTPSQSVPKSKLILNETFEMEAKSESDEEFVDACEDFEHDSQVNRISTSPINRTFEVSTPLSKSNTTFELDSKHIGFNIDEKEKPSANQTFDVEMSPVHNNETSEKNNETFDLGKPLNSTFDMEVDDDIPKIVLNSTFDGSQPLKCNKEAESPNNTLENTASTVVENITPNKTIETSSVCQIQDDGSFNTESVPQHTKENSFDSCNQSNSSSSDVREVSSNSLISSKIDHGCSDQDQGTLVKNEENHQSKVQNVDNAAKTEDVQPSVETDNLEVEKPKKAVKRGRKAKVNVETVALEQNSGKDLCQENNEDTVHACGQEDILTVPKHRSYKKRGKKNANCVVETEQLVQTSVLEEVTDLAPVKRRGRKPVTNNPENSLEQEKTETIQKTKRGRKAQMKDQEQSSEHEEIELIQKTTRGRKLKVTAQEQSSKHEDSESMLRSGTEETNEDNGKITTRRGRKPKSKECSEKNLDNDIEMSQPETQVFEEEIELPKKTGCNKPIPKGLGKENEDVSLKEDEVPFAKVQEEEISEAKDELAIEASNVVLRTKPAPRSKLLSLRASFGFVRDNQVTKVKDEHVTPEEASNVSQNTNESGTEQIVEQCKVVCFAQESNSIENTWKTDEEVKKARRKSGIPMGFQLKPTTKPPAIDSFPGEHSKKQNEGDQNDNFSKENSAKSASSKLDSVRKSFGIPSYQLPANNKRLSFVYPKPTVPAPESLVSQPKLLRSQSHKNLRSTASVASDKIMPKPSTKPGDTRALPELKKGVIAQTASRSIKAPSSTLPTRASTGVTEVKTKKAMTKTIKPKPQKKTEQTKTSPEPTRVRKTRGAKKTEDIPPTSIAKADEEVIKKPATRIKKIPSRKNIRNASTSSIPSPTVCATRSQDSKETTIEEQPNPRKRQKPDKKVECVPTMSVPTDELDQLNLGDDAGQSFCQGTLISEEMDQSPIEPFENNGANMVSNKNQYRDVEESKQNEQVNKPSAAAASKKTKRLSFIPSFKGITSAISSKINKKPTDVQQATNDLDNLKLQSPVKGKVVKKLQQGKDRENENLEEAAPKKRGRKKKVVDQEKEDEPTDVQQATNDLVYLKLQSPVKGKVLRKQQAKNGIKAGETNLSLEEAAPKKRGRKKKIVDEEKENEISTDAPESIQLPQNQTSERSLLFEKQIQSVESELEMLTTSEDTTKKTESKISKLESKLGKLKIKQESSKSKVCTRSLRSNRLKEQ